MVRKDIVKHLNIEIMKVTIYGAGQIGITAMSNILFTQAPGVAEVIMYSPRNHKRVEGAYMDLCDASSLINHNSGWRFRATGEAKDMQGSDLVFLCAGDSPTAEEYAEGAKKGIDDRMVQAKKNISILKKFCADTRKYAPNAIVFIVSNPVDMMTEMARLELPIQEVYGLGCYLDSARFKRELYEHLAKEGWRGSYSEINAWIIGHHCGTMFPHEYSLGLSNPDGFNGDLSEVVEKALARTRNRGLEITNVNKGATTQKLNNGAYFAPSLMVVEIMKAFVNGETILLPLNRRIDEDDLLPDFVGYQAQLLSLIDERRVRPCHVSFTGNDVNNMRTSIKCYEESKKLFFSAYNAE